MNSSLSTLLENFFQLLSKMLANQENVLVAKGVFSGMGVFNFFSMPSVSLLWLDISTS